MEQNENPTAPLAISEELMERAHMLVDVSKNLGLPLNGTSGPELAEAVRRVQAEYFMSSLDPESLKVGDGSDGLPVWIGIDAAAQKVHKIYASGLAQGFGDGHLAIVNGMQFAGWRVERGEQFTHGRHMSLSGDAGLILCEADPHPVFKTSSPNPPTPS